MQKRKGQQINKYMANKSSIVEGYQGFMQDKLLPVTHVLVDTWMFTVKLVYKLSNVPDDLKGATNTHMTTPFTLAFNA